VAPTDPVPDFVITVRIEGAYAIAEVIATGDADVTVAMDDLHRHTIDELRKFTWPLGYSIIETRWADVETINGRVQQMTAMAMLYDRDDVDWASIRRAVEQDQADLAELKFQEDLKRGGLT
jgi:hypothetical protein